jgi:hypothetical protein
MNGLQFGRHEQPAANDARLIGESAWFLSAPVIISLARA